MLQLKRKLMRYMLLKPIYVQTNYLNQFLNYGDRLIKKYGIGDNASYLLKCPKCNKRSSIFQSTNKDTYIFKCHTGCQFPTQRGSSSCMTLHNLIKNYGGSDLFQRWEEGVYTEVENTSKENGQNYYGMWGIKNRKTPKKGENYKKTFKERLQLKSEISLIKYKNET